MASDVSIKSYHVKHRLQLNPLLSAAKKVADYAVQNKSNKRLLTSKYVKEFGLPSSISNQILRKYGRGTIKEAHNVNLIIPNQTTKVNSKVYNSIIWENGVVTLKPLKLSFRWNPGRNFGRATAKSNELCSLLAEWRVAHYRVNIYDVYSGEKNQSGRD